MVNLYLTLVGIILFCVTSFSAFASGIVISEIHYNPSPSSPLADDGDSFEFIELYNASSTSIDISGYSFCEGVEGLIQSGSVLSPGQYFVVARSSQMFSVRYGTKPDAVYSALGRLSNKGERITLIDAIGDTITSIKYSDGGDWPKLADGNGFSLELVNFNKSIDNSDNWRSSGVIGGSPWDAGGASPILPIYINEVCANTFAPNVDTIELYNPNAIDIDISGWGMTDDQDYLFKYVFPEGTIIPADSYLVLSQGASFPNGVVTALDPLQFGFGLSSLGDMAYIFSATNGVLTGYADGFTFKESRVGNTINRLVNSDSKTIYLESAPSLGANNLFPLPGPLVLSEILYAPKAGFYEYLKIINITDKPVNIDNWDISGIGFEKDSLFADIMAGESIYIVKNEILTDEFRSAMGLEPAIKIFTFSGSLRNEGEEISILEPGDSVISDKDTVIPYYPVDVVRYNDKSPWPVDAADGFILVRKDNFKFGYEPENWTAVEVTGPVANIVADVQYEPKKAITLSGSNSIDPDGLALSYMWAIQAPGSDYVLLDDIAESVTFYPETSGEYFVKLVVSNGTKQSLPTIVQIDVATSLKGADLEYPFIYPTIAYSHIIIDKKSTNVESYRIVSINGSTLMEGKLTEIKTEIGLNSINLDRGYIIVNVYNDESVYAKQIFYSGSN